ncbi:MAG: co-chaperone GroES [Chloroflexota bacterium]
MATETATKIDLQPLGDRVVIRPSEPESQRPSGIYVAETAKEKPQKGTILAVGPGKWEDGQVEPMNVAVGDTVLFAKYAGTEIKLDTEEVLILSQKDILAKLTS